jgi:hypothetical protein
MLVVGSLSAIVAGILIPVQLLVFRGITTVLMRAESSLATTHSIDMEPFGDASE